MSEKKPTEVVIRDLARALVNLQQALVRADPPIRYSEIQSFTQAMQQGYDAQGAFNDWLLSDRK